MKRYRLFITLLLAAAYLLPLMAKEKSIINGKITDDSGNPLPSVNIYIQETYEGTTSGSDGSFELVSSADGIITLVASMVGYTKYLKTFDLTKEKNIIGLEIKLIEEAIELDEAVVMGSSFSSESGKGVVVTSRDIMTTPGGAADLYQSLKTMPGMTQVSESAELYVRGGDPSETITMIDQASIYHPYTYESSFGGLFSNLNTGILSEMYFSSGGFSAKYGNVLSGILDIQTKNLPRSTGFAAGISMAAASFDGEILLSEDKLGLRFYTQQSYTKPIMWMNGGLDDFTASPTSRNITSSLIYKTSQTGKFKITGIYADDKQGVNVQRAEYDGTFNGSSETRFLNLQFSELLGKNTLIKNSLSYSSHDNNWLLGVLDLNMFDRTYKFRADLEHTFTNNLNFFAGGEFENRRQTYFGVIPEEDYDYRPGTSNEVLDEKIEENRVGGYVEINKLNLLGIPKLFAIAGLRADYFTKLEITNFDQRFGIGYQLSDKSKLRFALGSFHQLPDFRYFAEEDGNPNLKSMRSIHYVLSYDYEIDKLNSMRVELYHKDYDNLPLEDDEINYTNDGYGYARGMDLILKTTLPFGINGWISYGFIDTKRKWLDFEEETSSSFDITHNLSLILKYNIAAMWQIGINFKYATGRPYTRVSNSVYHSDVDIYEPVYAEKNSARYPDYKRLDVRLTHLNQLSRDISVIFYLEALNILDINNLFGFTYNKDYTQQQRIRSYFGRRTIVLGAIFSF